MICDTSGLLAAFDPDDTRHAEAAEALRAAATAVLSPLVLAELDYLVRRRHGSEAARRVGRELTGGAYEVAPMTAVDVRRSLDVDERYAGLELGLTDASIVVLAERHGTRDLLTLDERHFRAVSPLQGGAFRLLPADV